MRRKNTAARSYYEGGTRLMLGGVPCRIARPDPTPTMVASYRETARDFIPRRRGHADEKQIKADRAAYAAAVKIGTRTVEEALRLG